MQEKCYFYEFTYCILLQEYMGTTFIADDVTVQQPPSTVYVAELPPSFALLAVGEKRRLEMCRGYELQG